VEAFYELGNEPRGPIKCWEVLEHVIDRLFLKKESAPWGQSVSLLVVPTYFCLQFSELKDIFNLAPPTIVFLAFLIGK
jgi:hypothetical protein